MSRVTSYGLRVPGLRRGLLITFDGLDSSGKATQTKKLAQRLAYVGWSVKRFESPDYFTPSGQELKQRLQNRLGNWHKTPWDEKMRLFARNRAEHREEAEGALQAGEIVVYDRYVPSSLAFMTVEALLPQEVELRRQEVQQKVAQYEYGHHGMPKEDVSIFLDVPAVTAVTLLEGRKVEQGHEGEYTDHWHVQERLYNEYDVLCASDPKHYLRVRCLEGDELLGVEDTAELVWEGLIAKFPQLTRR